MYDRIAIIFNFIHNMYDLYKTITSVAFVFGMYIYLINFKIFSFNECDYKTFTKDFVAKTQSKVADTAREK